MWPLSLITGILSNIYVHNLCYSLDQQRTAPQAVICCTFLNEDSSFFLLLLKGKVLSAGVMGESLEWGNAGRVGRLPKNDHNIPFVMMPPALLSIFESNLPESLIPDLSEV